jgi:hypothetical protein
VIARLRPVPMAIAAVPDEAIVMRTIRGATWFVGCGLK